MGQIDELQCLDCEEWVGDREELVFDEEENAFCCPNCYGRNIDMNV
jgi:Zn finger protein HypA/HybF involved in hydrogenase expression